MKPTQVLLLVICWIVVTPTLASFMGRSQLETVDRFNIREFEGLWYEIGHMPMGSDRYCLSDSTQTYNLNPDDTIQVMHRCRTGLDDKGQPAFFETKGRAWIDQKFPGQLRVSFNKVFNRYWISKRYRVLNLGRDKNHYVYAVIGDKARRYAWILSRTPTLDQSLLQNLISDLSSQGYDVTQFKLISHSTP